MPAVNELTNFSGREMQKIECTAITRGMYEPPEKDRSENIHSALQKVVHNVSKLKYQCGHDNEGTLDFDVTKLGNP